MRAAKPGLAVAVIDMGARLAADRLLEGQPRHPGIGGAVDLYALREDVSLEDLRQLAKEGQHGIALST
jgi:hypothetical protein